MCPSLSAMATSRAQSAPLVGRRTTSFHGGQRRRPAHSSIHSRAEAQKRPLPESEALRATDQRTPGRSTRHAVCAVPGRSQRRPLVHRSESSDSLSEGRLSTPRTRSAALERPSRRAATRDAEQRPGSRARKRHRRCPGIHPSMRPSIHPSIHPRGPQHRRAREAPLTAAAGTAAAPLRAGRSAWRPGWWRSGRGRSCPTRRPRRSVEERSNGRSQPRTR